MSILEWRLHQLNQWVRDVNDLKSLPVLLLTTPETEGDFGLRRQLARLNDWGGPEWRNKEHKERNRGRTGDG